MAASAPRVSLLPLVLRLRAFIALVVLSIAFSLLSPEFLTTGNLAILIKHVAINAILAIGMMLVIGVPTLPPVFSRLAQLLARVAAWAGVGKSKLEGLTDLGQLSYRVLSVAWVGMFVGWVITGLSYWAAMRGMGPAAHSRNSSSL